MAIVYSPEYNKHQDKFHIENKARTDAIMNNLSKQSFFNKLNIIAPSRADLNHVLSVHTPEHVNFIDEFCKKGGGNIDFDTYATSQSYQTALLSAGGAIKASKLVLNRANKSENWAFSISRPPGHHATSNKSMGFCIFNNVAIAVEYLRKTYGLERFCIVDFDVHYGNGTAEIFYNDPNVLYISIHQDPRTLFPGKGFIDEEGAAEGKGYNLNIPMPPGSNNTDYIWILKEILGPVLKEFNPQILFAEAGFDGHLNDPLSRIELTEDFYSWIGQYLIEKHPRLISLLEGGYDLKSLANSSLSFIVSMDPYLFLSENKNEKSNFTDKFSYLQINKSKIKYKFKEEIEKEYLEKLYISPEVKKILSSIKDNFSPYFKF
ncbi:MAG: histone deacetylase [Methanobacteriaceae archaeon]|nr:histone deacetylase [Methanobacteriaceae archaeon]MDP2836665.1 histone deacetylase [Methanobacteriaceae archaeon]MDP3485317.1 histone deacetylase [Methanobacteriaceae archaeon]MDP3624184.1 histone deacetylase [Methanobacteriaceae archaeon]